MFHNLDSDNWSIVSRARAPRQVIYHGSNFMSYDPDPSHYVKVRGLRAHRRSKHRGTEYVSDHGIARMSGSTQRQCD